MTTPPAAAATELSSAQLDLAASAGCEIYRHVASPTAFKRFIKISLVIMQQLLPTN